MTNEPKQETLKDRSLTYVRKISRSKNLAVVGGLTVVALGVTGFMFLPGGRSADAASYTGIPANDFLSLEQEIQNLQTRMSALENRVTILETRGSSSGGSTGGTPGVPNTGGSGSGSSGGGVVTGPVIVNQNGGTYHSGWDIYFTGSGFARSEQILISEGGMLVGHAKTDAGGSFSAPGIYLSEGTHVYTFTGQTSGVTAVASIRGIPDVVNQRH